MKRIAFVPFEPIGDSVLLMGELEEIKRLYAPCETTVFATPSIASLYSNYAPCDHVVALEQGPPGIFLLPASFEERFDAVFNHGYDPWCTELVRRLKGRNGRAYGMEEPKRPPAMCAEVFDKWVSLDYWENVTLKKHRFVPNQYAELIRLVDPDFEGGPARLTEANYQCVPPDGPPEGDYALFLPGASSNCKIYPVRKVEEVARALRDIGVSAVFAIGPMDTGVGAELAEFGRKVFRDLPFAELAWLIVHARLVVGNDSGPMHFAAAFDVPTLQFFSNSGADNWFCYDVSRHGILMPDCGIRTGLRCGDCQRACIGEVPVSAAVREAKRLLSVDDGSLK